MIVKLLISRAGSKVTQSAGDIVTVTQREGIALIGAGHAELVSNDSLVEVAVSLPAETRKRGRKKR
jgi:hypothetical protein